MILSDRFKRFMVFRNYSKLSKLRFLEVFLKYFDEEEAFSHYKILH